MTNDLFFDIFRDAKTNDDVKFILEEIKKYAIKHRSRPFKRGEVTINALNELLNRLQEDDNIKHPYICHSHAIKRHLMKYLGIPQEKRDDIYELKYN
jgi:hypothetical protein